MAKDDLGPSKKKKKNSPFALIIEFLSFVIVIGGVVAVIRINNINSFDDAYNFFHRKSEETKQCYKQKGNDCIVLPPIESHGGGGEGKPIYQQPESIMTAEQARYKGPEKGQPFMQSSGLIKKDYALAALDELVVSDKKETPAELNLSEWAYWAPVNTDNPCWTSKKEALAIQAVPGTVKFEDANHKETKDKAQACSIVAGEWIDPYSGKRIKDPKDMDVDHIVPISYANDHGGDKWEVSKKSQFANDVESQLLAVSKKSKKTKNEASPSKFIPENKKYKCTYAKSFTSTLDKYELTVDKSNKKALSEILVECNK